MLQLELKSLKDNVYDDRPIGSTNKTPWRRRGANDKDGHNNEVGALKEHHDINTL